MSLDITYSEYLAEQLDKSIEYAEYIAENLNKYYNDDYIGRSRITGKDIYRSQLIAYDIVSDPSFSEAKLKIEEKTMCFYTFEKFKDYLKNNNYKKEDLIF